MRQLRLPRWLRALRPAGRARRGPSYDRGVALRGALWTPTTTLPDALVVVGATGLVERVEPWGSDLPEGLPLVEGTWIGPGVTDRHVHLAFGSQHECLRGGVVAVRDLGAPLHDACCWQGPRVQVAGPIVTAPEGYPSRSWGRDGFATFADAPERAAELVRDLVRDGVDLIKVALETAGGQPAPDLATVRALTRAAHDAGLLVTAHALSADMVERALDAGVDELAHCPVELLEPALVDRIAAAGIPVVGTLQTLSGERTVLTNAARLVTAGVRLTYGTDLGNGGTRPGVDPRELERLAAAGLGREGALCEAVADGDVRVGSPAALVVLPEDPLVEPLAWRAPTVVACDTTVLARGGSSEPLGS